MRQKPTVGVHGWNLSTQAVKPGRSRVQGSYQLHSELAAGLGCMRPCQKKSKPNIKSKSQRTRAAPSHDNVHTQDLGLEALNAICELGDRLQARPPHPQWICSQAEKKKRNSGLSAFISKMPSAQSLHLRGLIYLESSVSFSKQS